MSMARSSWCSSMSSNHRRSAAARSLAVRAAHAGSAADADEIARRHSAAPMFGMSPSFSAVAGLCTLSVPPLSAGAQPPSMKHSWRSSRGSLSFINLPTVWTQRITRSSTPSTLENGRDTHAARGADRDQSALGPIFIENLGERGDDAGAGRGEGMADRKTASLHVEFGPIDGTERTRQSQLIAAENRIGPGLEGAEHLSGESLVDLVEIEVLQRKLRVAQHPGYGIGRRHEQALLLVDVIHGGHGAVTQISQHRQVALARPDLRREQYRRRTIRHGGRIARSQGPGSRGIEYRLELGELFQSRVAANVVVLSHAQIVTHQLLVKAGSISGGRLLMAFERQLVLFGARNSPALHHEFGAFAHRQAGARLHDSRQDRPQVFWAQSEPGTYACAQCPAAITLQQALLKAPGVDHRRITDLSNPCGIRTI